MNIFIVQHHCSDLNYVDSKNELLKQNDLQKCKSLTISCFVNIFILLKLEKTISRQRIFISRRKLSNTKKQNVNNSQEKCFAISHRRNDFAVVNSLKMQMNQQVQCVKAVHCDMESNVVTDEWNFPIFLRPTFLFLATLRREKKEKI